MNSKTRIAALSVIVGAAGAATAQTAVTGFTGGTPFGAFFSDPGGDSIGYRFTVNTPIVMQNVGMYNGSLSDGAVDASHQWGLWDSGGNLAASGVIDPSNGFQQGDFFYSNNSANFSLVPNERYTLAVVYDISDGDEYLSSVSSISTDPAVDISVAVAPSVGGLGLSFPTVDSVGNPGRLGPNFTFVPAPSSLALLGLGGLAATRRRR